MQGWNFFFFFFPLYNLHNHYAVGSDFVLALHNPCGGLLLAQYLSGSVSRACDLILVVMNVGGGGLQCITLVRWLEERYETVYRRHPGFQEGATPLSLQEQALPLDLPDTLRGEQWTFVQLPLSGLFSKPLMRDESFVLKPASACLSSDHVLDQYMFHGQD